MVYDETAVYLVRDTLFIALKLAAPILLSGVVIGLAISLFQSVTSIQEQTLTFVPKIVTMILVASFLLPWMALRLVEFTAHALLLF